MLNFRHSYRLSSVCCNFIHLIETNQGWTLQIGHYQLLSDPFLLTIHAGNTIYPLVLKLSRSVTCESSAVTKPELNFSFSIYKKRTHKGSVEHLRQHVSSPKQVDLFILRSVFGARIKTFWGNFILSCIGSVWVPLYMELSYQRSGLLQHRVCTGMWFRRYELCSDSSSSHTLKCSV
jgi:hypothetical protein